MSSIYTSILSAKNGSPIPLFDDGKSMESKYNPQNEAERNAENTEASSFFLILGIGSGFFIEELSKKYPNALILAVEKSDEDLLFLNQLESFRKIATNKNIILTSLEHLQSLLLENYLPSFYGNLKIIEQRAWIQKNMEIKAYIDKIIKDSLQQISRDFSVQAHFGKIWHNNIINNIKLYSQINYKDYTLDFESDKTAAVIAAGPSLDQNIKKLKEDRDKYIIFSTDTAYSSLLKNEIIPEVVVSIDGQNISHSHFIHNKLFFEKTLFVCDLCADFSACNNIIKKKGKLLFSISGHPLSELFYKSNEQAFIKLNSGAGTVTLAALDFAIKTGFSKIEVFAADFAYLNGKSYTKGTYLDSIYQQMAYKLISTEKQFDKLLFRTELNLNTEGNKTTSTLEAYRQSMQDFLKQNEINFTYRDYIYYLEKNVKKASENKIQIKTQNNKKLFEDFNNLINKNPYKKREINSINDLNILEIALLPLISWLRFYDNKESDFSSLLEKAYTFLKRNQVL